MTERVPRLVTEQLHAPRRPAPFDLEHHPVLERPQPRMREEEGDAYGRLVAGREPLIREEADRAQLQTLGVELALELADAQLEVRPFDLDVERIADPEVEEVVVGECLPRDLGLAAGQRAHLMPDPADSGGAGDANNYWSSTTNANNPNNAWNVNLNNGNVNNDNKNNNNYVWPVRGGA